MASLDKAFLPLIGKAERNLPETPFSGNKTGAQEAPISLVAENDMGHFILSGDHSAIDISLLYRTVGKDVETVPFKIEGTPWHGKNFKTKGGIKRKTYCIEGRRVTVDFSHL